MCYLSPVTCQLSLMTATIATHPSLANSATKVVSKTKNPPTNQLAKMVKPFGEKNIHLMQRRSFSDYNLDSELHFWAQNRHRITIRFDISGKFFPEYYIFGQVTQNGFREFPEM